MVLNTLGMAVGAAVLLAGAIVVGDPMVLPQQPTTWLSLATSSSGGSIGLLMLYLLVLHDWEASRAADLTLLMPPVAVVVGLARRRAHHPMPAGRRALILADVYVGAVRRAVVIPPSPPSTPRPAVQRHRVALAKW